MTRLKSILVVMALLFCVAPSFKEQEVDLKGFVPLFDGKSLNGWRKLTEYSGEAGKWEVIDGAIVGDQYPEGEGGLLVTKKKYRDFELYAEVKADYPIDSGLFLRVQPNVLSYQVTIDYRPDDGEVAAIYCPGGGGFLKHTPDGKGLWVANEYNRIRVYIKGQPAHIRVWLNDKQLVDFTDSLVNGQPRVPDKGFVGLQVHPGASWGKGNKVYFRSLMIKPLD